MLLIFVIEGVSGLLLLFSDLDCVQISAERIHTEYDPLLSWINKPNARIKNMYGPGENFVTNSQRFRNKRNFSVKAPIGIKRWICIGNSFTLGYGVDNDKTWAALLPSVIPGIETVNMGQGGYGMDQAYLWYMRDGVKIHHDVLVFAYISEEIERSASNIFLGYPKPRLKIVDGKITNQTYPVPKPDLLTRYLPRCEPVISRLNSFRLINQLRKTGNDTIPSSEELESLTYLILKSLHDYCRENHKTMILVHLPTDYDYMREYPNTDFWRRTINAFARQDGWIYIDLVETLRQLPPDSVPELFIQQDIPGFIFSQGHYSEKGNKYIAEQIARRALTLLPI